MFRYFLFVLLVIGGALSDQRSNNAAVDRLLKGVNTILRHEKMNRLKLNDINEKIHFEFFGRSLDGEFWADTGVVEDFATLVRNGNVAIQNQNGIQTIKANLKFGLLKFSYESYRMKYLDLDVKGGMVLKAPRAAATVEISMTQSAGSCTTRADKVTIDSVDKELGWSFTGAKIPENLLHLPEQWVSVGFTKNQMTTAENNVLNAIDKALQKEDLCKLV